MHNEHKEESERPVVFGEFENLIGVLREAPESSREDFIVLMLTPGMLHSAGPFRLHTQLASAVSGQGLKSLRFDLSGIGESLAVGVSGSSLQRAASEIGQAIDWATEHVGIRRVLCFGLCSGADDALFAAQHDERIVGVFSLDGCGYRTHRYRWERWRTRYLPKLKNPRKLMAWLNRKFADCPTPSSLQLGSDIREFPERHEAERQLLGLESRGVQMHFHYTGGVSEYYNYESQFLDMFPKLARQQAEAADPRITSSFAPQVDHVAFLAEHRHELVSLVCSKLLAMVDRWKAENTLLDSTESVKATEQKSAPLAIAFETPLVDSDVCV